VRLLSGRVRSALLIGLQGIRSRKLRTVLAVLSLFLGVLAVVVVQAGAQIANRALLADLDLTVGRDGTLQVFVAPEEKTTAIVLDAVRGRPDIVVTTTFLATVGEPGVTPLNPGGMAYGENATGPVAPRWRATASPGAFTCCATRAERRARRGSRRKSAKNSSLSYIPPVLLPK